MSVIVSVSDLKAEYELSMIAPWNRPFASGDVSSAPTATPPELSPWITTRGFLMAPKLWMFRYRYTHVHIYI